MLNPLLPTFPCNKQMTCVKKLFYDKDYIGLSMELQYHGISMVCPRMFDNEHYRQNDEGVMDSPLGPACADTFLCVHEVLWLEKYPPEFKPIIYKRYVNDTFRLFQNFNQIEKFKYFLNLQHANIKLTSQIEFWHQNHCRKQQIYYLSPL